MGKKVRGMTPNERLLLAFVKAYAAHEKTWEAFEASLSDQKTMKEAIAANSKASDTLLKAWNRTLKVMKDG